MLELLRLLSVGPARARDVEDHARPIAAGQPANLVLFDSAVSWTVKAGQMQSRSRNSAFDGTRVRGQVVHTVLRGRFTLNDGGVV